MKTPAIAWEKNTSVEKKAKYMNRQFTKEEYKCPKQNEPLKGDDLRE